MLPSVVQEALILNLEDKGWDSNFATVHELFLLYPLSLWREMIVLVDFKNSL